MVDRVTITNRPRTAASVTTDSAPKRRRSWTNVFVYLAAFASSWTAVAVGGNNVVDYLLVAAVISAVLSRLAGRRQIYVAWWMVLPFVASVLVVAWDVMAGDARSGELTMLFRVLISTGGIAILLTSVARASGTPALMRALRWWAAGAVVCGVAAIATWLGLVSFVGILEQPTGDRLSGLSSHPNSLAFSLTLVLPVLVHLAQVARGFWRTFGWVAMLALAVGALALTGSRAGLMVGLPLLGLALILALRASRLRVMTVPLLILGVVAVFVYLPGLLTDTRLVQGSALSDSGRIIYNQDALSTFATDPIFGGGFNAQIGVAVPLMVISGGGLVLVAGYYLFVFRPLPVLWKARGLAVAQTGLLALAAFLAFGLLNPVFVERATFWPILIPALVVLLNRSLEAGNPWQAPGSLPRR
ncbi:MAG: hypothetical protein K0S70_2437 [Microbacterium sp.]|jgi:hypothetical protein|nr:hypothetical protein [Microbacterium sp.]